MKTRNDHSRQYGRDYPFYRPVWRRAMMLTLGPLVLAFIFLAAWVYAACPDPAAGLLIAAGGLLAAGACLVYSINDLVRRLENKRRNITLMDQQLLKMGRLAASAKLTRDFLGHVKDTLVNIDSAAAWGQNAAEGNNRLAAEESLSQIKSEAAGALRSIDKLLSFTRPPGNQWLIQEIDVNQVITDMIELFAGQFRERGLQIRHRPAKHLPPIRSNASRLDQTLQDLFLAVIADIADNGELVLETAARADGIRVEMSYPGRHFDHHVLQRISDPAYALQSKEPGPWLALCMYHAERINGRIEAEKTEETGLKFRLTLPYRLERPSGPPPDSFLKGL